MGTVTLSLLVLKTVRLDAVRQFYEALGMRFVEEQHGSGPVHFAATVGAVVVEIYPLTGGATADTSTRLGFDVGDLGPTLTRVEACGATVVSPIRETEWGLRAVVRDPDGRSVELVQRRPE
jgi:predicted enzyme related to lactoylglutathione lyase